MTSGNHGESMTLVFVGSMAVASTQLNTSLALSIITDPHREEEEVKLLPTVMNQFEHVGLCLDGKGKKRGGRGSRRSSRGPEKFLVVFHWFPTEDILHHMGLN